MINRVDFEVLDQEHQMWAEGCQDDKPTENEIVAAVAMEGYYAENLDISFDTLQKLWRWSCDIRPITPSN